MVDSSGALVPGSGPETPAGRPWRSGLAHIWADSDLSGAHDGASVEAAPLAAPARRDASRWPKRWMVARPPTNERVLKAGSSPAVQEPGFLCV